jgi:cadmium resistance protein CadD (predicted permease)
MKKVSMKKMQLLLMLVVMCLATPIFASQPKIVTGTLKLAQTATTWLLGLIPVTAGLVAGFFAWQKSVSQDDAAITKYNKLIKNVIIGAVLAETVSGLITVILSFYK